jgi:hypothetical protein
MTDGNTFGEKEDEPLPQYRVDGFRKQMGLPPEWRTEDRILKDAFHLAISHLEANKIEKYILEEKVNALEHYLVMNHGITNFNEIYQFHCAKPSS